MIEDPPSLTLRRHFPRPDEAALRALSNVPTGFVVDCMDGLGALDYRVKAVMPEHAVITGTAVTCECGPADNLGLLGALDIAGPGDVIVASTGGHTGTAVIGDLVLEMMKNAGVAGFVTDGLARDLDGIERVGLPMFCAGITPNSPARNGPATAGFPVNLGAVHVRAGDVVVTDRDGVVIVPLERLDTVLRRLEPIRAAEANMLSAVQAGLTVPPFYQALVEAGRVVEES